MRTGFLVGTTGAALGAAILLYQNRTRCTGDFSGAEVIVIDSIEQWNRHKALFIGKVRDSGVVGFDCEWVSPEETKRRNKVALLQLAPNDRLCFLFRLCKLDSIPVELSEVLEEPAIVKVGVAALEDANKLSTDYGVSCNSCLDLRHMVLQCEYARSLLKLGLSLQKLAQDIVGVCLDKSVKLRCSDWEADQLTTREIIYAAEDALAAFLVAKKVAVLCSSPIHVLLGRSWMYNTIIDNFEYLCDIRFAPGGWFEARSVQDDSCKDSLRHSTIVIKKKSRQAVRNSPFYDNCILLAPDGEVLAAVKRRKADWYLEKGIASLVSEEPFTVRLKFEPKGRAILDKVYYTKSKDNQCVVCGARQDLVCKNVVPHEYRSFFPDVMTQHNSHDILLMCVSCHQRSNAADFRLREKLAMMCSAPLSEHKYIVNVEMNQLVRAAKALVRPTSTKIPEARRRQLEETIKSILKVHELTPELIESTAQLDPRQSNENFVCHGKIVVEFFAKNGGILTLETMWRKHFLKSMRPGYLPELWSIDHHHRSLAYELSTWKAEDAEQLLEQVGLTSEFVEQVSEEVTLAKERKRAPLTLPPVSQSYQKIP